MGAQNWIQLVDPFKNLLDDLILKPYSPEKILVHIQKGLRQRELILRKQDKSDDALKPFLKTPSLEAFTYPEILGLPKSLSLVLEDIGRDTPPR